MLHQRLRKAMRTVSTQTVRCASVDFGTSPAAIHAEALAALPDTESLTAWADLKTTLVASSRRPVDEGTPYWEAVIQP